MDFPFPASPDYFGDGDSWGVTVCLAYVRCSQDSLVFTVSTGWQERGVSRILSVSLVMKVLTPAVSCGSPVSVTPHVLLRLPGASVDRSVWTP